MLWRISLGLLLLTAALAAAGPIEDAHAFLNSIGGDSGGECATTTKCSAETPCFVADSDVEVGDVVRLVHNATDQERAHVRRLRAAATTDDAKATDFQRTPMAYFDDYVELDLDYGFTDYSTCIAPDGSLGFTGVVFGFAKYDGFQVIPGTRPATFLVNGTAYPFYEAVDSMAAYFMVIDSSLRLRHFEVLPVNYPTDGLGWEYSELYVRPSLNGSNIFVTSFLTCAVSERSTWWVALDQDLADPFAEFNDFDCPTARRPRNTTVFRYADDWSRNEVTISSSAQEFDVQALNDGRRPHNDCELQTRRQIDTYSIATRTVALGDGAFSEQLVLVGAGLAPITDGNVTFTTSPAMPYLTAVLLILGDAISQPAVEMFTPYTEGYPKTALNSPATDIAGWYCFEKFYGDDYSTCDCGCGAPDPDCTQAPGEFVRGCRVGATCNVAGECVAPPPTAVVSRFGIIDVTLLGCDSRVIMASPGIEYNQGVLMHYGSAFSGVTVADDGAIYVAGYAAGDLWVPNSLEDSGTRPPLERRLQRPLVPRSTPTELYDSVYPYLARYAPNTKRWEWVRYASGHEYNPGFNQIKHRSIMAARDGTNDLIIAGTFFAQAGIDPTTGVYRTKFDEHEAPARLQDPEFDRIISIGSALVVRFSASSGRITDLASFDQTWPANRQPLAIDQDGDILFAAHLPSTPELQTRFPWAPHMVRVGVSLNKQFRPEYLAAIPSALVPAGWNCSLQQYGDGYCDCGCATDEQSIDRDCYTMPMREFRAWRDGPLTGPLVYAAIGSVPEDEGALYGLQGDIFAAYPSTCAWNATTQREVFTHVPLPSGWQCGSRHYGAAGGECHCECATDAASIDPNCGGPALLPARPFMQFNDGAMICLPLVSKHGEFMNAGDSCRFNVTTQRPHVAAQRSAAIPECANNHPRYNPNDYGFTLAPAYTGAGWPTTTDTAPYLVGERVPNIVLSGPLLTGDGASNGTRYRNVGSRSLQDLRDEGYDYLYLSSFIASSAVDPAGAVATDHFSQWGLGYAQDLTTTYGTLWGAGLQESFKLRDPALRIELGAAAPRVFHAVAAIGYPTGADGFSTLYGGFNATADLQTLMSYARVNATNVGAFSDLNRTLMFPIFGHYRNAGNVVVDLRSAQVVYALVNKEIAASQDPVGFGTGVLEIYDDGRPPPQRIEACLAKALQADDLSQLAAMRPYDRGPYFGPYFLKQLWRTPVVMRLGADLGVKETSAVMTNTETLLVDQQGNVNVRGETGFAYVFVTSRLENPTTDTNAGDYYDDGLGKHFKPVFFPSTNPSEWLQVGEALVESELVCIALEAAAKGERVAVDCGAPETLVSANRTLVPGQRLWARDHTHALADHRHGASKFLGYATEKDRIVRA